MSDRRSDGVQRVERLRELMRRDGVDLYLVPSSDDHGNEYVPECWQRRRFISGFSGSAGDALIGPPANNTNPNNTAAKGLIAPRATGRCRLLGWHASATRSNVSLMA